MPLYPEKHVDKMKLRELKDSIDEVKIVAEVRMSGFQAAQEWNLSLSRQCQFVENELKDDQYIYSFRLYSLDNDQLFTGALNLTGTKFQAERPFIIRREKELNQRAASLEASNQKMTTAGSCGTKKFKVLMDQFQHPAAAFLEFEKGYQKKR